MPIIKLNGEYSSDLGWVHAVMAYPDDKQLRDQFFAVCMEDVKLREAKTQQILPVSTETLRLILEAPGSTEFNRMNREKTKRGVVAGNILASMYLMDKFSITEPSMNKAIFVVQKFAASATYGDGSEIAKSERMVREAWSQFHSVAHLWAAVELNKAYQYAQKNEIFSPEYFHDFLGVAASLYEFGISFVPLRAKIKRPILDPNTSWVLPDTVSPQHLKSDRSPIKMEKILKKYRAPSQH